MEEPDQSAGLDTEPAELERLLRAIDEHTNRTRYATEQDVIPLLRGIYDQVHATRHAIDRLVNLLEGGFAGSRDG